MQPQITQEGNLLDAQGNLLQSGWARDLLLTYDRENVHANPLRIKEWDYYEIRNDKIALLLVIYDVGYQAKIQATFIDFAKHEASEASEIMWFSKGRLKLPPSSNSGDISYTIKNSHWECQKFENHRVISFDFPDFLEKKGFSGKIRLESPKTMDSIVNVIPFTNPKQFVYAQKINCMEASGTFTVAGEDYQFTPENPAFGCLDWTRAVFPYRVTWWWSSASGLLHNIPFGLNFDYGFGTESSKNMLFYNHVGHHLDDVTYTWNPENLEEDWIFRSSDNRVNLKLTPTFINKEKTNFILLRMQVLKAYGYFTGTVILDSGEILTIKPEDKLFGHAEYVINRW